jgi:hypothetical protein
VAAVRVPRMRSLDDRLADVRALLRVADAVYARRVALAPALVASTGLSPEGVELGFESLERDASDEDLRRLVHAAGDARHVHVVLSANVFVAALRAMALAIAAAPRVTIRPSPRDPVIARALVEAGADRIAAGVALTDERDVAKVGADAVHVYGRDETIDAVRSRAPGGSTVVGHGAGMGVAWITGAGALEDSAARLAHDVATFDQRGCLSPRIALVEGDAVRAHEFASALHQCLAVLDARVPRGTLDAEERAEAVRWRDAIAFAGRVWTGEGHVVGLADGASLALPPPGRHVQVVAVADVTSATGATRVSELRAILAPFASAVVAVGSDDPARAAAVAPPHARVSRLGRMQRPALDGPVDRRTGGVAIAVT